MTGSIGREQEGERVERINKRGVADREQGRWQEAWEMAGRGEGRKCE